VAAQDGAKKDRPEARLGDFIPSACVRFVYRLLGLKRGSVYSITLIIPDAANAEWQWAIREAGPLENGHHK
jgi:hypothetical protein